MFGVRKLADWNAPDSLSNRMRNQRFAKFLDLLQDIERPVRLLDVGGTVSFWEHRGLAGCDWLHIVLGNLTAYDSPHHNIRSVALDATAMPQYGDSEFDVVFSNSVIEHLFTFEQQQRMAAEVQRVGRRYWVQTPNYWFPMEPHFHVLGWQWLPVSLRVAILRRRRCGWRGPCPDRDRAQAAVEEVRLMSLRELRRVFPGARVYREKFAGLTKSFVMYGGFSRTLD